MRMLPAVVNTPRNEEAEIVGHYDSKPLRFPEIRQSFPPAYLSSLLAEHKLFIIVLIIHAPLAMVIIKSTYFCSLNSRVPKGAGEFPSSSPAS